MQAAMEPLLRVPTGSMELARNVHARATTDIDLRQTSQAGWRCKILRTAGLGYEVRKAEQLPSRPGRSITGTRTRPVQFWLICADVSRRIGGHRRSHQRCFRQMCRRYSAGALIEEVLGLAVAVFQFQRGVWRVYAVEAGAPNPLLFNIEADLFWAPRHAC